MRVGVDKAGFNRLLVPYQHPLLSPNHLSSSPPISMPRVDNTYVIPFEPVRDGPGEFAYGRARFNLQRFVKKRGSRTDPYPSFVNVYQRSEWCVAESDTFKDLQLVRADCLATNTEYCDRCTHADTQATNVARIKTEGTKGLLQGQVAG